MDKNLEEVKTSEEKISDSVAIVDVTDPDGFNNPEKRAIVPKTIPAPSKVYTSNVGRGSAHTMRFEPPEWDLTESGRILDTESLVRRAFRVKKNLFLKEGYEFTIKKGASYGKKKKMSKKKLNELRKEFGLGKSKIGKMKRKLRGYKKEDNKREQQMESILDKKDTEKRDKMLERPEPTDTYKDR